MDELLLLCLVATLALIVLAVCAVLALGVVFGVFWLLWKGLRFAGVKLACVLTGESIEEVKADAVTIERDPRVSRRVRAAGGERDVRVQGGLVPASPCLAQRGLGGVERRRRRRARSRDE